MTCRRGRIRRLTGAIAVAGATLVALAAAAVLAISEARLGARDAPPLEPIRAATGAAAIARGRHLATSVTQCLFCHGDDLGGREIVDDPLIGRLHAPNLTAGRGGAAARYSDAELARAIRHGVDPEGRRLLLMPSDSYHALSDDDVAALIAHLRSVPPVDRETAPTRVGLLTRVVWVAGLAPDLVPAERIDHAAPHGRESDRGEYLVQIGTCRVCHHANLAGGLHPLALPDEPPPPDLRSSGAVAGWSEADFVTAMRFGVTPDGRTLDRDYMPWPRYAGMTDGEIRAIWSYLRTL